MLDTLEVLRPDAVFFLGDLADIPAANLDARGFDSLFRRIRPPLGLFGITGNHEAYMNPHGGTVDWMKRNGMNVLLDSTVCVLQFCITGRQDPQYARHMETKRRALVDMEVPEVKNRPWFVLDHQPKGLTKDDEKVSRIPDLFLSGHTHAGQFFPWNLVIHLFWKQVYGMGRLDDVLWFVSSGFGQWGPPIRVGTRSELVLIDVNP